MLDVGDVPVDFVLKDDHGKDTRWKDLRKRPVVVFFYPRASTPGCTKEACAFRDLGAEFGKLGVAVIGISGDSVAAQAKFRDAQGLTFPLLSDPEHAVLEPWGVYGEKKLYGKTVNGVIRSTFLFDKAGKVVKRWSPVKVDGHADVVLAEAARLVR
jgi:thioredoxin-dependent peroxiredoxin